MINRSVRFTGVALIASFLVASSGSAQMGAPPKDFTVSADERTKAISGMIARLNEKYVFPDVARKMELSIRAKQKRGEYDRITSAKELAEKLTSDFREISKDKHLKVFYSEQPVVDQDPFAEVPAEVKARKREQAAKFNFGFEKVERLQGNVGYLDYRGFNPVEVAAETATAAMNFLAHTDALIIDLRHNGGGDPAMVAYLSSYLFDQPVHLNSIYERPTDLTQQWWTSHVPGPRFGQKKPVFVLTANRTFSAAEEFTYNLKNLKRATIVGETTGGGAHPVMPYKASEHFKIGVPFARAINPISKTNWEGTGVTPDVAVKADEAFDTAYRLALQKVIDGTKDPQRKEGLQKLLQEKIAK